MTWIIITKIQGLELVNELEVDWNLKIVTMTNRIEPHTKSMHQNKQGKIHFISIPLWVFFFFFVGGL